MVCRKCGCDKPLSEFYVDKRHPGGYKVRCKKCINEATKASPKTKEYFEKNKKDIYRKHKEYRQQRDAKDRNQKKHKEWIEKNRDKIRVSEKRWRNENRNHYLKRISKYRIERRKNDLSFRIASTLRARISFELKNQKNRKRTKELLGCSMIEFRAHLESKFKSGMTWSNYGKKGWHIDHITPVSKFDLSKTEEQLRCFHYTNMQPLWEKDNLSKSNKIL